jgi:S-adenosyl methyltransferase
MSGHQAVPPGVDISKPSPARMYDYYLGGKDNWAADRAAAEKALSVVPRGRQIALANRRFLARSVKYIAGCGISQFVDIGTGIPTSPNVHETARLLSPDARVAYVDNDPVVIAHNRALLADERNGIAVVQGDIRSPLDIITNPALTRVIDFSRPLAVLLVAVLHFVTNEEDPYQAVAAFRDRMPAGSYLVLSHITSEATTPAAMSTIEDAYRQASAPAVFRARSDIESFFTGLNLIKPGLVHVSDWRRYGRKPANPPALDFLGGVGRKP